MGKSAQAPDYRGAAQQQAASSQQAVNTQTQQNRPDISGPFASQQWTMGPDGTPHLNTGFQGGLGAGAASLANQAGSALGQGLDPSLFSPIMGGDAARNQAINAAYGQATSRLDPQWNLRQDQMRAQLQSQGLDPNSEAFRNSMRDFSQQRNDAYGSAMNSAIGMGNEASNQVFNQNLMQHQTALADALRQRSAPIEEMQQLQGLTATPQFHAAGMADPTQYLSAAQMTGDFNLQNTNQQNQMWGNAIQGLFGLGGPLASAFI